MTVTPGHDNRKSIRTASPSTRQLVAGSGIPEKG